MSLIFSDGFDDRAYTTGYLEGNAIITQVLT